MALAVTAEDVEPKPTAGQTSSPAAARQALAPTFPSTAPGASLGGSASPCSSSTLQLSFGWAQCSCPAFLAAIEDAIFCVTAVLPFWLLLRLQFFVLLPLKLLRRAGISQGFYMATNSATTVILPHLPPFLL